MHFRAVEIPNVSIKNRKSCKSKAVGGLEGKTQVVRLILKQVLEYLQEKLKGHRSKW